MKTTEKKLRAVLTKIEKSKNVIAKERDKLREIYDELEMLLESFDEGIESLNIGKHEMQRALDAISQFV